MFKRAWADYGDDEELPPIPWGFVVIDSKIPNNSAVNKFWLLNVEENSDEEFDEDYCLGCETGADASCAHTCCN